MIKSKKMLWIAIILFIVSAVMNFPFPHAIPYGETVAEVFNFPIRSANGWHYVGIASLTIFIASIFFLTRSLKKYHMRAFLLALLIAIFAPGMVLSSYQKNFAKGVDAVHYNDEVSKCEFEMVNESTLSGECKLSFENYSSKDVQFTLEFHEDYYSEDDVPMVALMNNKAPYEVSIEGKEKKVVKIKTNIDVSNIENHVEGGSASDINIIIRSGDKIRKL
ncbi:hypothetical protein [Terribacillus saccharophilus]|uniref:Uncharacterized protein n=1 Tax=Terribacillus saccharophilus TaxID=361277 RepID=A0ABX4GZ37_9BACI|nr:hypothetical protein [Terribacillus saccharophilus]PAD35490.1 hypothetical protein CHH56_08485 [Terribacillus saccharophilus]PAD96549.1 hypothetical protein CHH50_08075 [Terribacillus saccharophilus]PAE00125.1 hypothetical protein CHH48_08980 [Terribacillus saccharophilus]